MRTINVKVLAVFVLLCCFCVGVGAQANVRVCVIESLNNGALVNAKVYADGKSYATDSLGCVNIPVAANDTIVFGVTSEGFNVFSKRISISGDTNLQIVLQPFSHQIGVVVIIAEKDNDFGITHLKNIEGTSIYAGKKTSVIRPEDMQANLAANSARQLFSKIPGINVFENDGAGVQLGIGGRGLNPNRVSNFSTRQNGYDISADALGYPESYYSPPSEALGSIEIIRGAASLQYGTQFGGLINFRFKDPDTNRIQLTTRLTYGSFAFLNSFTSVSGTVGKFRYYSFYQYKQGDGWRPNSQFALHAGYFMGEYVFSEKLSMRAEYTHMQYLAKQPGGLTDRQFETNPSVSNRNRNWFDVNWNLAAYIINYKPAPSWLVNLRTFGLHASRKALGSLERPDRADDTTAYRKLLSDNYDNIGTELRVLHHYTLGEKINGALLTGGRLYFGNTRQVQGDADKTDQPNFYLVNDGDAKQSEYLFPSRNISLFAENIFYLIEKFNITPGIRYENILTVSDGYYKTVNRDLAGNILLEQWHDENRSSFRELVLFGLGMQYRMTDAIDIYANVSQNYRSINFNDIRVLNTNFRVDPNLQDENGYTVDIGAHWMIHNALYIDAGVFMLRYNNRIGTVIRQDSLTYSLYNFRTNVSDSRNLGVEIFAEYNWLHQLETKHMLSSFVNYAHTNARYISSEQNGYEGKVVELVPANIFRTGITWRYEELSLACKYSYTSEQFTDASNAISTPSAIFGIIPAYSILDASVGYSYKWISVTGGVNNILNTNYFTRRAEGYPGPGILPSDPRNYWITLSLQF
jgi:Fe(3+) dicitrate transport protein